MRYRLSAVIGWTLTFLILSLNGYHSEYYMDRENPFHGVPFGSGADMSACGQKRTLGLQEKYSENAQ